METDELTLMMKLRLISEAKVMALPLVMDSKLTPLIVYLDW